MRPLIGVPCHGECGDRTDAPRQYTLDRTYVECIGRAGGPVVMIPSCRDPELLRSIYNALSGLLLAGGGDIRPECYRQPDSGKNRGVDPERDEAELLLARWAAEDNLPLLAICRGIQVLNVALGGTLIQDIPSEVQGALVHNPGLQQPRRQVQHPVAVATGSRLASILGAGLLSSQVQVNSFHHQAVDEIAPALRMTARAPDGIVEGLEWPDRDFVLGVQWHPEEMASVEPAQQAIFAAFVAACTTRRRHGPR